MRKRFEVQYCIGQRPIEDTQVSLKSKDRLEDLIAGLKAIFCNREYSERIFSELENRISKKTKKTGRPGMCLWHIFVLAQVRLGLNIGYDRLHNLANNHFTLRFLMGVEYEFGFNRVQFEYQNIYDNVCLLDDEVVRSLNDIIVEFGHNEVFKKKSTAALVLKTDSFVVESNVHFPTDYNLLWDCARKCLDAVEDIVEKHPAVTGWRKVGSWYHDLKGLMRELGKASSSGGKGKQERVEAAASRYLAKSRTLLAKLSGAMASFPLRDDADLDILCRLEYFIILMNRHVDLVHRRIIKKEEIPHAEKMFSIFEQYTEWIKKGKSHPSVELGKMLAITTDQYNLIVDYRLMHDERDRDIVIELADRMLARYKVRSWSFDKGYWNSESKQLLQLEVELVVMPKLGKRNATEEEEERTAAFRRGKHRHSAVESNINELEHCGLDRCPDRSLRNFSRYIGLGVCAYNIKKIGTRILEDERQALKKNLAA